MNEYINGWSIKQATDQLMLDAPHTYTHMPLGSAHGISDRIHSVRASIRDYFNAPNCPLNRFCHAERKHVQGTCCAAARQEASAEQQRCVAGSLLLSGPTNLTCALVRIRRSTDEPGGRPPRRALPDFVLPADRNSLWVSGFLRPWTSANYRGSPYTTSDL